MAAAKRAVRRKEPPPPPLIRRIASRAGIPDFLNDVERLPKNDRGRLWSRAARELRHLKTVEWWPAGGAAEPNKGYAQSTLRVILRDYRNAVRAAFGEHPILQFLKTSILDQTEVKNVTTTHTIEAQKRSRPIDVDGMLAIASSLLREPYLQGPFILAAALLLVTGRRPVEILKTAHFHRVRRNAKRDDMFPPDVDSVIFAGQVKTRGAKSAQTEPYRIPVLVDPEVVLEALAALRSHYDLSDLTNDQVVDRTSKSLNGYVKRYFADDRGNALSPKDLRGVYALIASETLRPAGYLRSLYVGRILGHSERDTVTALSYMKFYEAGHKRDFDREKRKTIRATIAIEKAEMAKTAERDRLKQVEARIAEWKEALAKVHK